MTAITGLSIINQKSENVEDRLEGEEKREAKQRRMPRKATSKRLERVALHYLKRFSSSSENLRRVLMRRVERSARAHGTDREEGAAAIDAIVTKFQEYGYLNDRAYAEMRAGSLFRRGSSLRVIRYQLSLKGITGDIVDAVIADLMEEEPDPDRRAAVAYGRRRRIGPWRRDRRDEFRDRDLAALGRQGFSYDIARWIVQAETPDELEAFIDN
ncbi:MAG: RecX family transcriptional regulator [Pseudomonadota bacterium]|nr:RecX family transcriptional regulator [Pseudomonadota bacterium]